MCRVHFPHVVIGPSAIGLMLAVFGLGGTPKVAAAQLGTAVGLGVGVTAGAEPRLPHVMAAVRLSPQRLQPASIRIDGTLAVGLDSGVGALLASAMVPLAVDTAANVPYILLGAGMLSSGDHRRAAASMGVGLVIGRGALGLFTELRAYSTEWPRVTGTIGIEF